MSTFIKAGLWTKKKTGYLGELDLNLLIAQNGGAGVIATSEGGTMYSTNPIAGVPTVDTTNSIFLGNFAGEGATTANDSNFFGYSAGESSSGNNVNAFGANAGQGNALNGQTIFSNASMPSYVNRAAAVAAITVLLGGSAGSTYLYYNETTFGIEAVRL